jgi:hypothetical protein
VCPATIKAYTAEELEDNGILAQIWEASPEEQTPRNVLFHFHITGTRKTFF